MIRFTVQSCIFLPAYSGQEDLGVSTYEDLAPKHLWKQVFNVFSTLNLRKGTVTGIIKIKENTGFPCFYRIKQ